MKLRKRSQAAQAAPAPREPSFWQEPPAFFVTVLERLLAMPDGTKHVRLASHVCHHWRVAAQEVLLADTAISKPPMEDFRAIGQQHPLPPVKQHKQETVTTQAAVVLEASASTGMEAISKQRFDGPPGTLAAGAGFSGRARGRLGRPAQPAAQPRLAAGLRQGAMLAAAAAQQQQQQPNPQLELLRQAAAERLDRAAQQQQAQQPQQQPQQAQQQASVGPGGTAPAAPAHAAGASPSAQQPGDADAPQGSIQSGMAIIGRRGTAALESESEGGSTRARGPTKRRRVRRGSELSGGRGMSVEQPLCHPPPQQAQQAQQAASPARRAGSTQQGPAAAAAAPAAQGTTAGAAGTSRPSSRRRRRSVSTAGTEVEGRPSKRQQVSEPRQGSRAGLRSSGPASMDGLPETQQHRPQQARKPEQQQGPQAAQGSNRRRQRPSKIRFVEHAAGRQQQQQQQEQQQEEPQQPGGEQAQAAQPAAGKPADPVAASGSYGESAEGGAEVEQHMLPLAGGAVGEGGSPWEQTPGAEGGGFQAAFNVVWRLLRLRD
ncbi:hypothetical protein C2E21_2600 [Chlorella sorokiniana]|uniref:Uncharacterized protein n=1 Tax=Chlorella sorokiniana TaxID=3076 RepID=A0A2P6TY16_CHLSO|nr:hypothetical protein C2E21_2600 [Chlorella sorokiniana]|eukprot:PRW58956.1 hypothetical protein C2E21_2600 [Chlorella sorokiniana]